MELLLTWWSNSNDPIRIREFVVTTTYFSVCTVMVLPSWTTVTRHKMRGGCITHFARWTLAVPDQLCFQFQAKMLTLCNNYHFWWWRSKIGIPKQLECQSRITIERVTLQSNLNVGVRFSTESSSRNDNRAWEVKCGHFMTRQCSL